jgi:riboflavin-specific deaminase-like protein
VVKQLFPLPGGDVDVDAALSLYGNQDRRAGPDRPYVVVNMVASIDGVTAVDGVSKALGSPTDRAIFLRLRDLADAIVVGAATARAERYGPARPTSAAQAARLERGQAARPPIVVVSRSVDFDWETPFFADADPCPILLVPEDVDRGKRDRAAQSADVMTSGTGAVDLPAALGQLRDRGIEMLLCEGGPTLNAQLLGAGLVDELCLTVAPVLVGGPQSRGIIAGGITHAALSFPLAHVLEEDSFLYLRYCSAIGPAGSSAGSSADLPPTGSPDSPADSR